MANYCTVCGASLLEGARFCSRCGAPIGQQATPKQNPPNKSYHAETVQPLTRSMPPTFEESTRMMTRTPPSKSQASGAATYGFGPTGWIKGTFSVLFGQIGSMVAGFFKIFAHARALLFAAAICALWIWINHLGLAGEVEGATEFLSKLTYARGGTGGPVVEIIGGALGKGIVGAALCSILYGGILKAVRGIGNIFSEPGFNIGAAILGFGAAALAYQFTAGFAGEDGFMVGIAGAFMALQALSMRKGFLVNLAASFSARKVGKNGKELLPGRYKGFLTGAAAGFLVWMFFCVSEKTEELGEGFGDILYSSFDLDLPAGFLPYSIPLLLILIGLIVNAIGKGAKHS